MINTVILAGRYSSLNKDIMTMDIAVKSEGNVHIFVPVLLSEPLLKHVKEIISIDDLIGIKGFVDNKDDTLICVAEKITFLSKEK